MKKRLTMFLAALFLTMGPALAQTKVSGTVLSQEDGQPIIGAAVKVDSLEWCHGLLEHHLRRGAPRHLQPCQNGKRPPTQRTPRGLIPHISQQKAGLLSMRGPAYLIVTQTAYRL